MPVVTESGFSHEPEASYALAGTVAAEHSGRIELPNDADANALAGRLQQLEKIRIPFPSAHDGRGFSLARRLRQLGYRGRLQAAGHVISDQFRHALACGFDEVAISDELAARQPEAHWRIEDSQRTSYRDRLFGRSRPKAPIPAGVFAETVTGVEHYGDSLFRFRITRPESFRFQAGEFVMIGLPDAVQPVFRAYSIASAPWDETLEFYSIKVPGGPLTEKLKAIRPGDTVLMRKKATGTLVSDALAGGKRLWLFATGTGIAPFASLIEDPATYERFEQVILVQGARTRDGLKYGIDCVARARRSPLVHEEATARLIHYPATTREISPHVGRITDLLRSGQLFLDTGLLPLDPCDDRAMICGSMAVLLDLRAILTGAGFNEGSRSRPGSYVIERAFVDTR